MHLSRVISLALLLTLAPLAGHAAEVASPEEFLQKNFGWTIQGLDGDRGVFGKFRNFTCFDDRLMPPATAEDVPTRRWATPCSTVRLKGENLAAMMFVTWVNDRHPRPVLTAEYEISVAEIMAGSGNQGNAQAKCSQTPGNAGDKPIVLHDCTMVLPFGTFYANFISFTHRGIVYYVRAQNASNTPSKDGPREAMQLVVTRLKF